MQSTLVNFELASCIQTLWTVGLIAHHLILMSHPLSIHDHLKTEGRYQGYHISFRGTAAALVLGQRS
jgi:hypothetical protein